VNVREPGDRPGLQAERTGLSWERTATGLLASGALLLFRHDEPMTLGRAGLAAAALLLALLAAWLGRRRARVVELPCASPGGSTVPDARREVLVIGFAVAGLALGTALLLVV
jgi:putative membrane protein